MTKYTAAIGLNSKHRLNLMRENRKTRHFSFATHGGSQYIQVKAWQYF